MYWIMYYFLCNLWVLRYYNTFPWVRFFQCFWQPCFCTIYSDFWQFHTLKALTCKLSIWFCVYLINGGYVFLEVMSRKNVISWDYSGNRSWKDEFVSNNILALTWGIIFKIHLFGCQKKQKTGSSYMWCIMPLLC